MSLSEDNSALEEAICSGEIHSVFFLLGEKESMKHLSTEDFITAYDHWNKGFQGIRRQRAIYPQPKQEII